MGVPSCGWLGLVTLTVAASSSGVVGDFWRSASRPEKGKRVPQMQDGLQHQVACNKGSTGQWETTGELGNKVEGFNTTQGKVNAAARGPWLGASARGPSQGDDQFTTHFGGRTGYFPFPHNLTEMVRS